MRTPIAAAFSLCLAAAAFAQTTPPDPWSDTRSPFGWDAAPIDEPLVTDRPDFTESTVAVPRGRIQLEAGYTFTHNDDGGVETNDHTAPELLLRVGVIDGFELRFGWTGYSWNETRTGGDSDWAADAYDISLGAKLELTQQDGAIPSLAVLGSVIAPSGGGSAGGFDWGASITLAWGYDLTDRLSLGGNFNLATAAREDNGRRYIEPAASVALGYMLTDRLGSFVEYFGFYPGSNDADIEHYANTGLTYLVTNNLQLDARVGVGINGDADDFFTGAGFSIRF